MHSIVLEHEKGQLHMVKACQNTSKDKPAFIKRLIKVFADKNSFFGS